MEDNTIIISIVSGAIAVGSIIINFLNYRDRLTTEDKKKITEELDRFTKQNDKDLNNLQKQIDDLIEEFDSIKGYSNKVILLEERLQMIHTRVAEIQAEQTRRYEGINVIMKDLAVAFRNSSPNIK